MGIFNNFANYSGLGSAVNEAAIQEEMDFLENIEDVDLGEDLYEACVRAAVANEQNFNMIMMSVANEEVQYFMENGTEMIYEEGKISAFFDKIKTFLEKAWQKIKSIFNKCAEAIGQWVRTDKSYLKHKDAINTHASSVVVKGGYDTKHCSTVKPYDKIETAVTIVLSKLGDGSEKTDKNAEDFAKEVRQSVGGDGSKESMINSLKEGFGMDSKKDAKRSASEIISELESGKGTKKAVKAGYNAAKKSIASMKTSIKGLEAKAKSYAKNTGGETSGSYGICLSVCNSGVAALNACQRVHISALNNEHRVCRAAAQKCITLSKEKDSTNASYIDSDFAGMLV